jgi:hypothetical protein
MYVCELCCVESAVYSMYSHILGVKHREKYLAMKYNISGLSKPELIQECNVRLLSKQHFSQS